MKPYPCIEAWIVAAIIGLVTVVAFAGPPMPPAPVKPLHAPQPVKGATATMQGAKASLLTSLVVIVPPAVPTTNITFQWTSDPTNVVKYDFYCGTDSLAMSNHVTVTRWLDTNGVRVVTLSGFRLDKEYFTAVDAVDYLGNVSTKDDLDFIAPRYLLVDDKGTVSFFASSSKTYTLQSTVAIANVNSSPWKTELSVANFDGVKGFTNASKIGPKYFRLAISP